MQPQEIFDTVVRHLAKQGHPAMDGGSCLYRAPNGDKCAVGCLIPDHHYDPDMEGKQIWSLLGEFDLPSYIEDNSDLLDKLQDVHDNWVHLKGRAFAVRLHDIAILHNLKPDVVEECFPDSKL